MQKFIKLSVIGPVILVITLLSILFIRNSFSHGSSESSSSHNQSVPKHVNIGKNIDFEGDVKDIISHYNMEGMNWVRMNYPDVNHRDIALRLIGNKFPKMTIAPLSGNEYPTTEKEKVMFILNKANTATTKKMATEIEMFRDSHKDTSIVEFYPLDSEKEVRSFKELNDFKLDEDDVIAGNSSEKSVKLMDKLHAEFLPMVLYVDSSGTIAYTQIGFQDSVYLNEGFEWAFGKKPFYNFIEVE